MGAQTSSCCSSEGGDAKMPIEPVTQLMEVMEEKAAEQMMPEPVGPTPTAVVFTFQYPDEAKTVKEISFTVRPLGMDFSKTVPLTVKKVKPSTPAADMKVPEMAVVIKVDGKDIPETFEEAMKMVKEKVMTLADGVAASPTKAEASPTTEEASPAQK